MHNTDESLPTNPVDRWPVAYDAVPARIPCGRCKRRLTWAESRAQYGRARQRGLSHDEAQAVLPRCQKCMTRVLREWAAESGNSNSGGNNSNIPLTHP